MNHDTVSRAAATVVLVDRPDEALDPALAEDERQFSIVGGDHRPVPSFETGACVAAPVVAQLAIAFAAEHSSGTDAAGPLPRRHCDRAPPPAPTTKAIAPAARTEPLRLGERSVLSSSGLRCPPLHSSGDGEAQEWAGWRVGRVLRVASFEAGHAGSSGWAVENRHFAK